MEHAVNAGEGNVFVAPPVACDVVQIQQFVVVGAGGLNRGSRAYGGVCIGHLSCTWTRVVGDVVQEGVARAESIGRAHRRRSVALQEGAVEQHQLGQTVGPRDEVAVEIREDHRHVAHIGIREVDAEQGAGLGFHLCPVGDGSGHGPIEELAGATHPTCLHRIGPQERLVGWMGGVGLVLINPGCGGVVVGANIVGGSQHSIRPRLQAGQGGPGEGHEIGGAARHKKGIVRSQGDDHAALAAFGDQAEAVIKELAENGEEGVVRGRQTDVRRNVGDEEAAVGRHRRCGPCGRHGDGVAHRLV